MQQLRASELWRECALATHRVRGFLVCGLLLLRPGLPLLPLAPLPLPLFPVAFCFFEEIFEAEQQHRRYGDAFLRESME